MAAATPAEDISAKDRIHQKFLESRTRVLAKMARRDPERARYTAAIFRIGDITKYKYAQEVSLTIHTVKDAEEPANSKEEESRFLYPN